MIYSVIRGMIPVVALSISVHQACGQTAKHSPSFNFDNASLSTILKELSNVWKVKVCNPKQLTGVPLTAGFPKNEPLKNVLADISYLENGHHVYLRLSNGVIYIDNFPFPDDFAPDKRDWPCP